MVYDGWDGWAVLLCTVAGEKNRSTLRSLYYPPVNSELVKEDQLRCGEHSDYGSITLVFQGQAGGLQVQTHTHTHTSALGQLINKICMTCAIKQTHDWNKILGSKSQTPAGISVCSYSHSQGYHLRICFINYSTLSDRKLKFHKKKGPKNMCAFQGG